MKLRQFIERIPEKLQVELEKDETIAKQLEAGVPLELILTNISICMARINLMKRWEIKTLRLIVIQFADQPFHWVELERAGESEAASGAELIAGLTFLRRKGIVFAMRKSWGEPIYVLPSDTFILWQSLLMPDCETYAQVPDGEVEQWGDLGRGIALDIFFILSYVAREKLALTQKGTIHKRHIPKMAHLLFLAEARVKEMAVRYTYADVYPAALAIVLDMALRLGLLYQNGQELQLRASAVNRWLQKAEEGRNRDLYYLWKQVHLPATPAMLHFAHKIESFPVNEWILLDQMIHWVRQYAIIKDSRTELHALFLKEWLEPLCCLGWIELGQYKQTTFVFRWKIDILVHSQGMDGLFEGNSNSLDPQFYVQPDYEIVVPPGVPFSHRWELECMAEHIKTDPIGIYRLTKETLSRAIANGRTAEECFRFLEKHAFYEVPDNVVITLRQWGEVTIEFRMKHHIQIQSNSSDIRFFKLDSRSLTPAEAENRFEGECFANDGLVYSQTAMPVYDLETSLPSVEEMFPHWREIPSIWLKDCRVYHASTRKIMVQKAIEWKACLKLRIGSMDRTIIPTQLQEHHHSWSFIGMENKERIHLQHELWEEMQIVLPGLNE